MTFLLLTIQSVVCCGSVYIVKKLGFISFRDFDMKDAKAWFPISALLVSVIYTGSKSLVSVEFDPDPEKKEAEEDIRLIVGSFVW